jgi:hypothetical protein
MFRWLSLTLLLCASGCYAEHGLDGRTDAGSAPRADTAPALDTGTIAVDGGSCRALPTNVNGLSCPSVVAPGAPVSVTLDHGASACCGDDAARLVASRTGDHTITLSPSWDSCGCCEDCECVGPVVSQSIDVGPLTAGTWTVIGDAARGVTCTIIVEAVDCDSHPIDEAIVPDASPFDEPLPVLLRASGGSCGCIPRGEYDTGREGGTHVGLERCGCSDIDPCVDPGYEATALVPVPPFIGPFMASTDVGPITSQIVDVSTCNPGPRVVSLEPLGIDPSVIHDAPIHVFGRVVYEAAFCCAMPLPLAREVRVGAIDRRVFELLNCVTVDCLCDLGPPQRVEGIVYLGVFAPGATNIRFGELALTIDVP